MTTSTITIDCQTCPVRGRMCGDCFVPVLGRAWLQDPEPRSRPGRAEADARRAVGPQAGPQAGPGARVPLDTDELAAVSAFVRAGLVDPVEAEAARAVLTGTRRVAAG